MRGRTPRFSYSFARSLFFPSLCLFFFLLFLLRSFLTSLFFSLLLAAALSHCDGISRQRDSSTLNGFSLSSARITYNQKDCYSYFAHFYSRLIFRVRNDLFTWRDSTDFFFFFFFVRSWIGKKSMRVHNWLYSIYSYCFKGGKIFSEKEQSLYDIYVTANVKPIARCEIKIYGTDFCSSRSSFPTHRKTSNTLRSQGQTNERMRRTANRSGSKRSYRCRTAMIIFITVYVRPIAICYASHCTASLRFHVFFLMIWAISHAECPDFSFQFAPSSPPSSFC